MSGIFGHLGVADTERIFTATQGQAVFYDAIQAYLARVNAEVNVMSSLFVSETTSDHKRRYKLPGGGTLQRTAGAGRYGAVKAFGSWDIGLPLEDFGAQIAGSDIDMRYMTVKDLSNHVETVTIQNINTVRFEILKALLNKSERTFVDDRWGSLLIEPLANGDAVLYPPLAGVTTEATRNRYKGLNYTVIDDSHNPFITIRDDLESEFGQPVGGSNIVAFIHPDQRASVEGLIAFDEVVDRFITPGANTDVPNSYPTNIPGTIIGRVSGCWVSEWRSMPTGYILGFHMGAPAPLVRRIDPADTGLGDGLQLVARDLEFPFESSFWRHRFGLGVGNRLNGEALQLVASTTYTTPTAYA